MSGFKEFLDKVLVTIGDGDESVQAPVGLLTLLVLKHADPEYRDPKQTLPPGEARLRYDAVMNYVLADAAKRGELQAFTDVLTEKLAQIAFTFGAAGTGDVLRRLGGHLESVNAYEEAWRAANYAREYPDAGKDEGGGPP